MNRPECGTCIYFDPEDETPTVGQCHAEPGRAPATDEQQRESLAVDPQGLFMAWFPSHCSSDWCGRHPDFPAYLAFWKAARSGVGIGEDAAIPDRRFLMEDYDAGRLSIVGAKVIGRGVDDHGWKTLSDLTEANLAPMRNCGPVRVLEILAWKQRYLERLRSDEAKPE